MIREHECERWGGRKVLEGGMRRVFYGLLEEDLYAFCHVSEGWQLGCGRYGDAVFRCFFAF